MNKRNEMKGSAKPGSPLYSCLKNPIGRLLRRNMSAGQIAGYAVANLVGLVIVLTALQFYRDITSVSEDADSFISSDYIIISKRVDGVQGLGGMSSSTTFSPSEREDIASQPWAAETGEFTSADFNISARVDIGGAPLSTALFLESIPDEFFDIMPRGWGYNPGSREPVPVIISKDYLTLYNFGFAASRGLPQISEELIGMLPLRLSLSGNGRQQWVDARIAGFSSRLNTIAVPEDFMAWANGTFGEGRGTEPSRMIIRLDRAGNPDATAYMDAHGYEIAGDKAAGGKAAYFLSVVTTVVVAIGVIISVLAFFILLLSIYLLLQKNRAKIHDLMLLGYTPGQVARYYIMVVAWVNGAVLAVALTAVTVASVLWHERLDALGASGASPVVTYIVGLAIMAAITAGNIVAIRRNVRGAFRG